MALGKGIPVINGFDLNSKLPLDSRTVADTAEEMNALVTNGSVGDGQLCYCKADKKLYVLKEGVWSEVGGEGGGKPLLDLSPYYNRDTEIVSQEGMSLLSNKILNNEIVGISLGGEFSCMLLDGIYGATIDFLSRVIDEYGRRVKVLIAIEDGKVSQKNEYASLTLPSTSPTSQLIPSITTSNEQQNLTIGDGLTIENGVLKATSGGGSNVTITFED